MRMMKLTADHYAELQGMMDTVVDGMGRNRIKVYHSNMVSTCKGDPSKRTRWDLLWMVNHADRTPWFDKVYKYANDDHIDTALRAYVKSRDLF